MTLTEFLKKLERKTKRTGAKWRLIDSEDLRTRIGDKEYCPLWFLSGLHEQTEASIKSLRLKDKIGEKIYRTADGYDTDKAFRKKLLKAVGLA